jgi:hypothetical protein
MTKRKEANRTILDFPVGKCFASAGEKPMILVYVERFQNECCPNH